MGPKPRQPAQCANPPLGVGSAGQWVLPRCPPFFGARCGVSHFPLWDALQFAPRALQLHPPFFLPVEEAQFSMGPPHQSTARACKNFSLHQVPGTNWFGDGGQGFSRLGFPCPCPPCVPPAPPRTLVPDAVP